MLIYKRGLVNASRFAGCFLEGRSSGTILQKSTDLVIANDQNPASSASQPPIAASSLSARLLTHDRFSSKLLAEQHDLRVYVPPMYEAEAARRFPVLYMHDGQNLFDPATSFIPGNYWHLGETADALSQAGVIEPLIIVGIYNSGEKRIDEYTPVGDTRLGGGHADAYGAMLVQELKPFIDAQYRTLSGTENCGMGGASLGGLVTLYLGLKYPGVFSQLAVMSPSVWWRNRAILKTVGKVSSKPALRIWLDIGLQESLHAAPDAQSLRDKLIGKGWQLGEDLAYVEAADGEHTESAWAKRAGAMLTFLFPARKVSSHYGPSDPGVQGL